MVQGLYKDQEAWLGKVEKVPQDQLNQIQNMPVTQQFVAMANILGLQDWAAARGVPQAKTNQCLSDQKMIDHEVQVASDVSNQFPDFSGTPTFVINGKMLPNPPVGDWEKLKPELDAALK
jgi:protein-disulfide isomerase